MATTLYQAAQRTRAPYSLDEQGGGLTYEDLTDTGQVARGLRSSLLGGSANSFMSDSYQAAAAGDLAGAQAAKARAEQLAREQAQYAPRVQSTADIHGLGDFTDWAGGIVGQLPTTLVPAVAGGMLGGGLGGALVRGAGATLGSLAGASGALYPQLRDAARMQQSQAEAGGAPVLPPQQVLDDTSQQAGWQSVIEGFVPGLGARSLIGAGARVVGNPLVAGAKRVGRDIALDTGAAGVAEGVAMNYESGRNPNRDTSGDQQRYIDAMAGEAIGGGVVGLGGATADAAYSALGTGARATGDAAAYAARLAEKGGRAGVAKAKQAWDNRPQSLDEAAVMVGEGAANVMNQAEDAVTRLQQRGKDPDVDVLLAKRNDSSEQAMRADDQAKHQAATNFIAKNGADTGLPEYVRKAMEEYKARPNAPFSWEPLAAAVNDMHREQDIATSFQKFAQETALKVGEGSAKLMNAKDDAIDTYRGKRAADGRANAQTPDMQFDIEAARDELSPLIDEALAPLTGLKSQDALDNALPSLTHGMRAWVENGFALKKGGEPVVPAALLRMFTDPQAAVSATVDLLYRQGLVGDDIRPIHARVQEQLQVKALARQQAGMIIDDMLLPTKAQGLSAVDHDLMAEDLMDRLQRDEVSTAEAKALFGPRARVALDALRAKMAEANPVKVKPDADETENEGAGATLDAARTQAALDTSDRSLDGTETAGDSYEDMDQMTTAAAPSMLAEEVKYHHYRPPTKPQKGEDGKLSIPGKPAAPFMVGGQVKNKDGSITYHDKAADKRIADLQALGTGSIIKKQGYLDYLREAYANDPDALMKSAMDLAEKDGGTLSNEALNKKYYVLREESGETSGPEGNSIDPSEFDHITPNTSINKWAEGVGRDRVSGDISKGRIWLKRASDGEEFATSSMRIIRRMLDARDKSGSKTAIGDLAGQAELLHQGLASLLTSGVELEDGSFSPALKDEIGFMDKPGGKVRWTTVEQLFGTKNGVSGAYVTKIPDNLVMYSSSGQTYGEAIAAARAQRDEELMTWAKQHRDTLARRAEKADGRAYASTMMSLQRMDQALKANDLQELDQLRREDDYKKEKKANEVKPLVTSAKGKPVMRDEGQREANSLEKDADGNWDTKAGKVKATAERAAQKNMGTFSTKREAQDAITNIRAKGFTHEMRVVQEGKRKWSVIADVMIRKGYAEPEGEISEMGVTSNFRSRQEDSPNDKGARNSDETTQRSLEEGDARPGSDGQLFKMTDKQALAAKAEAAAAAKETRAQRTAFLVDGLSKSVPGFIASVRKVSAERQAALVDHLKALSEAGKDNPIWGGKPPADMKQFAARARVALVEMGAMKGAVKGPIAKNPVMNVWHKSGENAALSNLASRPFKADDGRKYLSVEHAYQSLKSGKFDQATYDKYTHAGVKIAGNLGTDTKFNANIRLMEDLVRDSFLQNKGAAKQLLATGDARFTHTQDTGVWAKEFPRILEKVRDILKGYDIKPVAPAKVVDSVSVKEHQSSGYRERTKHNADSAGLTVAIAADYSTAGEKLTKSVAGDKYLAIALDVAPDKGGTRLAKAMRQLNTTTLNVAGNGIYTLTPQGHTQASINQHVYDLIKTAHDLNPITKIVTGGQTGVDLAGAVAAHKLGIPVEVTMPKNFVQRDATGRDAPHTASDVQKQITEGSAALKDAAETKAPSQKFADVAKKMNDYLDNPPADFNVKQVEAIRDWATKQEARLNEAKAKYEEGDDRWDELDGLRFEATMLKAKAEQAIKNEAAVAEHAAENGGPRYNAQSPEGVNNDTEKSGRANRGFVAAVRRQGDEFRRALEARGFDPANTRFEAFTEGNDFGPAKGSHWLVYRGSDGLTHAFSVAQELVPQLQRVLARSDFQNETKFLNALSYFAIQHAMFDTVKKTFDTLGPMAGSPAHKLHADSIQDTGLKLPSGEPLLRVLGTTPQEMTRFFGMTVAFHEASGGTVGDVTWERVSGARAKNTGSTREGSAKFNKQDATPATAATKEDQEKFHADILRRLGPQMKSGLLEVLMGKNARGKDIYLSGKWEKGAIYASLYARDLGQIGAHESFHEFFSRMRGEPAAADVLAILDRAANSPVIVRQLERLLDGETEALKQIKQGTKNSAEERMAYMFQFWQAGLLKIGPETETVFQKLARFFRKVAGLVNADEKADMLLRAFDEGRMQTPDAAARVLAESVTARSKLYSDVNTALRPALDKGSRLINTTETNLERQGVKEYHMIRRLFKRAVGETGGQGYLDAKDHMMKQKSNELFKAFQDDQGNEYSPADLALAAKYLHTGKTPTDKVVKDIVKKLTGPDGILPRMHGYLTAAGVQRWEADPNVPGKGEWVPMGKIDKKYFPRVYDTSLMITKPDEFVADFTKYNAAELDKIAAEQNAVLAKGDKDFTPVTSEDVARNILNRLINAYGEPEIEENSSAVGFSPVMAAVNKRSLHWMAPEMLEKYGEKDVARIMTSYIAQGVKRAEYVRRFGNGGERLQGLLEDGYKANVKQLMDKGMSADDAKLKALKTAKGAATDVMALEGTLGYDIKPGMRRFQNSLLVYENMRLLSTSLFSQFIDPLNMVVRGGTMSDAWNAYKRGLREVVASIKGDPIKDLDAQISAQVGTLDANGFLAAFGQLQSSQYMGDKFRKVNEAMFKFNGMEGFNRGMQIAGTRSAINFIKRHVQQPNKNSEAFLGELNLKAADVKITDGELDYANPRIQRAIHQWVNGAVLRPNASQRPGWSSDPHYMVFWHMKQFAYTFHDVVLKRALYNFKTFGDLGPAGVLLAAYAPVMVASDAIKGILLTGDEPAWMHGGLDSQLNHGVNRAGLAGKFQPLLDTMGPNRSVLGLGGPAVEQIGQMFEDTPGETAVNAMPGANVLNRWTDGRSLAEPMSEE